MLTAKHYAQVTKSHLLKGMPMVIVFQQSSLITTPTPIVNYGVKTATISHFGA